MKKDEKGLFDENDVVDGDYLDNLIKNGDSAVENPDLKEDKKDEDDGDYFKNLLKDEDSKGFAIN